MTPAEVRRAVRHALTLWQPITDTDRWEVTVFWQDTRQSYDGRSMGVVVQPQYESAELYVNVDLICSLERHTVRQLEYETLHELCHLHSAQLARLAEQHSPSDRVGDAAELATKKFASALWRAKYGKEPPV